MLSSRADRVGDYVLLVEHRSRLPPLGSSVMVIHVCCDTSGECVVGG